MTREEAIEIVKKNWPEGRHQIKAALEFLVPELKESEDERIYNLIYSSIKNDMSIGSPKNKELALAWLEKQKEQNPAEWSDEDRTTIERIVETIQDYAMETGQIDEVTCGTKEPLITYIRFLRSLRPQPHWKPSEDLLEALDDAIRFDGTIIRKDRLRILYEQLKQL